MFQRIEDSKRFNGSCFQDYLEEIIAHSLLFTQTFGECSDGHKDEEKGYNGNEWVFENTEDGSVYKIYSRWGEWRVGAHVGSDVKAFKAWLLACVTPL